MAILNPNDSVRYSAESKTQTDLRPCLYGFALQRISDTFSDPRRLLFGIIDSLARRGIRGTDSG